MADTLTAEKRAEIEAVIAVCCPPIDEVLRRAEQGLPYKPPVIDENFTAHMLWIPPVLRELLAIHDALEQQTMDWELLVWGTTCDDGPDVLLRRCGIRPVWRVIVRGDDPTGLERLDLGRGRHPGCILLHPRWPDIRAALRAARAKEMEVAGNG